MCRGEKGRLVKGEEDKLAPAPRAGTCVDLSAETPFPTCPTDEVFYLPGKTGVCRFPFHQKTDSLERR